MYFIKSKFKIAFMILDSSQICQSTQYFSSKCSLTTHTFNYIHLTQCFRPNCCCFNYTDAQGLISRVSVSFFVATIFQEK